MDLWIKWWKMVRQLRPAFARETTFRWFALCLVGLTVRPDLRGVTSIIRAPSPAYGETHVTIRYRLIDLLWRPVGIVVRFVLVIHPQHGSKIFMTTDLSLLAMDLLRIYGF